jgi:transcriptional regulator with GAF, ATPase, and Fis domain
MSANRAALIDTINKGRPKRTRISSNKTVNLRLALAGNSTESRVRRLVDLASSVMREAQILARDKVFADESTKPEDLDVAAGVDFYGEVKRFETALIKLALGEAGGNQARAARLLGLRATTLNSKIKLYNIEY